MKKQTLLSLVISFLLSACNSPEIKTRFVPSVDTPVNTASRYIFKPDELLTIHNKDVTAFKRIYNDSTIFIKGDIEHVDEEHHEVLLKNSFKGNYIVCLFMDSVILSLLEESDRVMFKGICKEVGGNGLVLIDSCQLTQLTPSKAIKN